VTNHAPAGLFSDGLEAARRVPDRFPLLISLHDLEVASQAHDALSTAAELLREGLSGRQ